MNDKFEPPEQHVMTASALMDSYHAVISIDNWATDDLVDLLNLIDIELQQRAQEAQDGDSTEQR